MFKLGTGIFGILCGLKEGIFFGKIVRGFFSGFGLENIYICGTGLRLF